LRRLFIGLNIVKNNQRAAKKTTYFSFVPIILAYNLIGFTLEK